MCLGWCPLLHPSGSVSLSQTGLGWTDKDGTSGKKDNAISTYRLSTSDPPSIQTRSTTID